jgi:hypothetical protein
VGQDGRIVADRTQDACASVDCPSGYRTQEGRASVSRTRSVPMTAWSLGVGAEESSHAGLEEVPRSEALSRVEETALAAAEAKGCTHFEGSYWNYGAGGCMSTYSLRLQQSEQPNAGGEHECSPPRNGQSGSGNAQPKRGPSDRAGLSDFAANKDAPYKLFSPLQPVPSSPDQLCAETANSWNMPADAGIPSLCELDSSKQLMAVNSIEGIPAVKRLVDYGEVLQTGCSREERPDRRRKSSLAKTTSLPPETRRPRVQFTNTECGFASTKST